MSDSTEQPVQKLHELAITVASAVLQAAGSKLGHYESYNRVKIVAAAEKAMSDSGMVSDNATAAMSDALLEAEKRGREQERHGARSWSSNTRAGTV